MFRKSLYLILFTALLLVFLAACAISSQVSGIDNPNSVQSREPEVAPTLTIQPTEIPIIPTPTEEETSVIETEVIDLCTNINNPCECLGRKYEYDKELGEIKEEYIGSWHAAAFVGSGYSERFVFFSTGNYLFFPSQYECDSNDASCKPSPIVEGVWGIQDSQMILAKDGDINNIRSILVGEVIDSPPDESPYPFKTFFDGTTYWLLSKDTNVWNPDTGELCDGY
ncbi:MAG: hypothetical protein A2029_02540 [Chloroflexi bacterium RBG_19FT_COMBO_47_9]|uniref:Lipocalin-like domain-containing protein n=1 Tax=Candidatus Woykebacteria bacterium RBG_13_40_15 TaxID=1802593 RepID=A0A1G1W7Z5_9BACT|nr:MAG: hypothetical protein A2029_02540 [Chloroflexi bacterium RBG_19FT_COMBO_47_9]OGY23803.1 MAG: hypothetical protein A2172_01840 [Candidatus Woykebacteria bacterium RBG_13_40_15]